jgi:cysteine sulfinate desulfinase/cysteine desulfurase-like protein
VTYLPVDGDAFVDLEPRQSPRQGDHTGLHQHANQEFGTLQDIKAIADIGKSKAR